MSEDDDLAFAMFLQQQLDSDNNEITAQKSSKVPSSLVDKAWEVIDPNPDVRQLFLQFNDEYFDGLLGGVEVRWSPRMTVCAGLCSYEGRGGLCSVRLSEPLLKLRPRKDLVQTLLHEMIHALLFVTQNNKDHDGHGPEFHKHMYRINKQAGTNISVYHNFHDEVNVYRQHWWKCNGPCQKWSPFYGVVKRTMNKAPAPMDTWWNNHQRKCGGEFTKVKEPENYGKRKTTSKSQEKNSGTLKGKGNVPGAKSGNPSLLTFFDKMKKSQSSNNSNGLNNEKGNTEDDSDENKFITDSSDENIEHLPKKLKMDDATPHGFMPFAGQGYVLGSSKTARESNVKSKQSNAVKNPLTATATNSNFPSTSKQTNSSTDLRKATKDTKKKLSGQESSYTIIDAFNKSRSTCDHSPDGTKIKPIILSDQPSSSSSNDVSCPACQSVIPISLINNHLDTCLTTM